MVWLPMDLFQLIWIPALHFQGLSFYLRSFVGQVDAGGPSPELCCAKESLKWAMNYLVSAIGIRRHHTVTRSCRAAATIT